MATTVQLLSPPTTTITTTPSSAAAHARTPAQRATFSTTTATTPSLPRSQSFGGRPAVPRSKTLSSPTPPPPSFLYTYSSQTGLADLANGLDDDGGGVGRRRDRLGEDGRGERADGGARTRPSRQGFPLVQSRTMPLSDVRDDERERGAGAGPPLRRSRKETLPADYWARAKRDVGGPTAGGRRAEDDFDRQVSSARRRPGAPLSSSSSTAADSSGPNGSGSGGAPALARRPTIVEELEAKIVFLGSPAVGKTSIIQRFTTRRFAPARTTVGTGLSTRKQVVDGVHVRLQLWDAAGQERFRSIAPMYYRGAHVAILVYDVSRRASFDELESWLGELRDNGPRDVIIHVVGAKADLGDQRQIECVPASLSLPTAKRQTLTARVSPRASSLATARRELRAWLSPTSPSTPSPTSPTTASGAATASTTQPTSTSTTPVRPTLALPSASRLTFANPLRASAPPDPSAPTSPSAAAAADEGALPGFFSGRARRKSGDWASSGFGMDPPAPASSGSAAARAGAGQADDGGLRRKSEEWSRRSYGASASDGGGSSASAASAAGAGKRGVSFVSGRQEEDEDEDGIEGIHVWETSSSTSQGTSHPPLG